MELLFSWCERPNCACKTKVGTEGVNPACPIVLCRIIRGVLEARQSSALGSVVVEPAIAEPEEVLRPQRLIDARREFILGLDVWRGVDRVVIGDANILQWRPDLLDEIDQRGINQI